LNPNRVYQYNLQTKGSIATSQVEIIKMDKKNAIGALQLAPDGKIYVSTSGRNFLGVIQEPNLLGTACSYKADAIELKGKATYGLPNFVQGFLNTTSNNLSYFDKNTIKVGDKLILSRVQFDYGLSSLIYSSFTELDALVNYMQKYPRTTIKLSGHTDNIGNDPANVVLSQNRAKAIKDYLVGKHIAESRISFEGFGSGVPLFSNDTEESRAKNRRVEVAIFEK
jgi:outer membrane protein OmpA-like peptidoglycan-associated protein